MAFSITWCEPPSNGQVPVKPFGLNGDGVAMHEVLRLLTGSVDLNVDGKLIKITSNELKTFRGRSSSAARYTKFVFDNQLTEYDYSEFLRKYEHKNINFFKDLKGELALCLIEKKQNRFQESFLYLYRIVEHISLAFPMMFALTHDEFQSTYRFLQSILQNDKEGDLRVLKTAMQKLADQANLSSIQFEFSVSGLDLDYVSKLKSEISASVKPHVADLEFEDQGDTLFRVPFNSMPSFFVTVRNRLFHYKLDQRNISLVNLGGADTICRICLEQMLHWFSLVYTEIMRVLAR